MTTTNHLTRLADAHRSQSDLELSTLGTYAVNDGKFFHRLKSGAGCTLRTATRVLVWFDANWPEDLEWPADIPRPTTNEEVAP